MLGLITCRRLAAAIILLPMAISSLYFLLIADDRYVSESIITVHQADQPRNNLSGLSSLIGAATGSSHEDVSYLRRYFQSPDLIELLDRDLAVRKHFQGSTHDPLQRLDEDATREDYLEYYKRRVDLLFDENSSTLTLRVQGFTPEFAQRLNAAIIAAGERFVNTYSRDIAREQLSFAEQELGKAENRLVSARKQVLDFQAEHKILDPMAQAQAVGAVDNELRANLVRLETELRGALGYLHEGSYQVVSLRGQIAAIKAQLTTERTASTTGPDSRRINALAAEYQGLMQRASFAEGAYKLALTAAEAARVEATRKLKGMVTIQSPTLPQSAEYPRRIYNLITLLLVCALLFSIASLVIATIREHQY